MSEEKQRNVYLTAWLVLLMVCNLLAAVFYLIGCMAIGQNFFSAPKWLLPVLAVIAIVNVGCAYALFLWKKWGFYGFISTAVATVTINLINGAGLVKALLGLIWVVILFAVLNIGEENDGWSQLE